MTEDPIDDLVEAWIESVEKRRRARQPVWNAIILVAGLAGASIPWIIISHCAGN